MTYLGTPEDRSRKKCSTRTAPQTTTPEQNATLFRFFWPRWPWPLTLTFEPERDFCTMHLTAKYHHHTFNHLEVIVLTNKQTDKQTDAAGNIQLAPLCYAQLSGSY